jgi:tRNA 2-thiouridine synthesizing protein E
MKLALDEQGHLLNYSDWDRSVGEQLAIEDGFLLSEEHWEIICLVRDIYLQTETSPPMRLLVKAIKINISEEIANSRHLYKLFPDGPVRLSCKYAGLPKPKHCL